ncbi:MAG: SDR family NAD(P)-dependent oxidoreductase [Dehalococcoidia bacterium]
MAVLEKLKLDDKVAIVTGAGRGLGRAMALALAEAGADVAVVAATTDAEAAFAVQRLSRSLAGQGERRPAQAIDGTNEMAVRVMVRQIGKALGGLDAVVLCADPASPSRAAPELALRFSAREMTRRGGSGTFVLVGALPMSTPWKPPQGVELRTIDTEGKDAQEVAEEALARVASGPDSG